MNGKTHSDRGDHVETAVNLERRHISALAALTLLGGAVITVTNCGGGSGAPTAPSAPTPAPPPPPTVAPACPTDAVCGQVSVDPDHSAVITGAQLAAGGSLVIDIRGAASHNHTVSLTASEVIAIRGKSRVVKTSTTTLNHEHTVTFN